MVRRDVADVKLVYRESKLAQNVTCLIARTQNTSYVASLD